MNVFQVKVSQLLPNVILGLILISGHMGCHSGLEKSPSPSSSDVSSDWVAGSDWEAVEVDGASFEKRNFVIDWKCGVNQRFDDSYIRDEYCEWDRLSRPDPETNAENADAEANDASDDILAEETQEPMLCSFRSNFVKSDREFYLTQKRRENSLNALVVLHRECTSRAGRHCYNSETAISLGLNPADQIGCSTIRGSDPHICAELQRLIYQEEKVVNLLDIDSYGSSQSNPTIQLMLLGRLPRHCRFDVDPELKEKMIADGLSEQEIAEIAHSDKTFVSCEIPKSPESGINSCEDFAPNIRAGFEIEVMRRL